MNKKQLIDNLMTCTKGYVTHADMERIVNCMVDTIKNAVAAGDSVSLIGFGTFTARNKEPRNARNPQTGETIHIPARRTPFFRASKAFKDEANEALQKELTWFRACKENVSGSL